MSACMHVAGVTCDNCDHLSAERAYFADKRVVRTCEITDALPIRDERMVRLHNLIDCAAETGQRALAAFGQDAQISVAQEECAELIVALAHLRRGRVCEDVVAAEVADVLITALQMMQVCGVDAVLDALGAKVSKLVTLVGSAERRQPNG